MQKYCACHTERFLARFETCCACHTKRGWATFDTSKSNHFCNTPHRHGQRGLTRTAANSCERLRLVAGGCGRLRTVVDGCAMSSERTLTPQTSRVKREPLLRSGKNRELNVSHKKNTQGFFCHMIMTHMAMKLPTHARTHARTHSLTHSLTYSLTHMTSRMLRIK